MRPAAPERVLAGRLHAAYPDELDGALAVVDAFTSAIRAAAEEPADRPSRGVAQQLVDRVMPRLEHGLGP